MKKGTNKRPAHEDKPTVMGKLIVYGLLLTALLPLAMAPSLFFPYITARNLLFRILTEILLALVVLDAVLKKGNRPRFSPILAALLAFTLLLLLSGLLGTDPARSFFSNFERMEGGITFIHLLAWFAVAAGVFRRRGQWETFFRANLVVSAVVTGIALLQVVRVLPAQERIGATFGNPIYLSYYLYFSVFLCAFFLVKRDRLRGWSLGYMALLLLQAFVLVKAATRGVLLGFLAGMVVVALVIARKGGKRSWQRRSAIALLLLVALAGSAFLALRNTDFLRNSPPFDRFARVSLKNLGADTERVLVWKIAWQGIRQRPLLGWGQENFAAVFSRHYDPRQAGREQWYDRAHNTYLEWWLAAGILGLAAYLGIFAAAFFVLGRLAPASLSAAEKGVLFGALAGYMLINFFDFDNLISYISFVSILAFIHSLRISGMEAPPGPNPERLRSRAPARAALSALIVIAAGATMVALHRKPMLSLFAVSQALTIQPEGPARNLDFFRQAMNYRSFGREEILRQLIDKTVQINLSDNPAITGAVKKAYIDAAREEMRKMTNAGPVSARLEMAFGSLLNRVGSHEEALDHLENAARLFPNKPSILHEKTVSLLMGQRYGEALKPARAAFELNPDVQESRKLYAVCAICAGDQPLAESLLLPVFHTVAVDDDRFILAYTIARQWPRVIQIYSGRLERDPADLNSRVGLAQALLRSGERRKAVEQIEAAIRLRPSFREQGLQLIRDIINSGAD